MFLRRCFDETLLFGEVPFLTKQPRFVKVLSRQVSVKTTLQSSKVCNWFKGERNRGGTCSPFFSLCHQGQPRYLVITCSGTTWAQTMTPRLLGTHWQIPPRNELSCVPVVLWLWEGSLDLSWVDTPIVL